MFTPAFVAIHILPNLSCRMEKTVFCESPCSASIVRNIIAECESALAIAMLHVHRSTTQHHNETFLNFMFRFFYFLFIYFFVFPSAFRIMTTPRSLLDTMRIPEMSYSSSCALVLSVLTASIPSVMPPSAFVEK